MLTDHERKQAIICAFAAAYDTACLSAFLKIPYLNPKRIYVDQETGRRFTGEELRYAGLAIRFSQGDFPAVKIALQADPVA